tara:strand:- start:180 stop:428 length:249 start_codon:yes stop_codon:yes gene_type:complete
MNKFIVRMLELGAELDKAVSPIEISMVINDAEILYKEHIKDHQSKVNNGVLDDVSKSFFCQHKLVLDCKEQCFKCQKIDSEQ